MLTFSSMKQAMIGTALAAALAAGIAVSVSSQAIAQTATPVAPSNNITLSVGTGRMVRLPTTMSDIFVADTGVADVQVRSANQIFIFGKGPGQTSVFATDRGGRVI